MKITPALTAYGVSAATTSFVLLSTLHVPFWALVVVAVNMAVCFVSGSVRAREK